MNGSLAYAFSTGMLAAINPCGFALLPAYLSYYLGLEGVDPAEAAAARNPLPRALLVSAAMTAGFVLVFGIIGAAWSAVADVVGQRLPWVIVGLGIVIAILGIAMVAGFVPVVKLPKLATTSGSQSAWSAFVFGISYGVASLSCTIPLFLAAVTTTFGRSGTFTGLTTLVAYALGMGAIICVLTIAVGFARQGIVRRMRNLLPYMGRISGCLLIVSGLVATYYGWYEARVLTGGQPSSGFAETIAGWRDSLASTISDIGTGRIGIAVVLVVVAAVLITVVLRRRPPDHTVGIDPPK
ncbi:MAG: cytochrome c biogenesis CcdA family protein [Acidimicrobiales bacterium]